MTDAEKEVMSKLVEFWNAYVKLPQDNSSSHSSTVCNAVHMIQGVLAMRVAARVNPEVWSIGE
jgi:hypothetical protein